MEVWIDKHKLENFQGDGILLSSSFGSTAYNLSFGGAIVPGSFHTLQLTPIAPLNSKVYRTLRNSIILPSRTKIELIPRKGNGIKITRDGENKTYEDVQKNHDNVIKKRNSSSTSQRISLYRENPRQIFKLKKNMVK